MEWHQTQQLLRSLDNTDGLDLPVCVEHRDKPDFLLSTRSCTIGLETTSFTDEEVMRADHLHFTRFPNACITTTGLRDGAHRRSSGEIEEAMFNWTGPWESVAYGADHVARKILESIRLKRQKFHSADFEKFDQNWLSADRLSQPVLRLHHVQYPFAAPGGLSKNWRARHWIR